jgi:hypothetical protein
MVAHWLVLLVGRFIRRGEDARPAPRVAVELVPFIRYLEPGRQVSGGGMPAVFDDDRASLISRMGRVGDAAQSY